MLYLFGARLMERIIATTHPFQKTITWVCETLNHAGLTVMNSFDLQTAREGIATQDMPCPPYNPKSRDCQMMVILVYNPRGKCASLVAYRNEGGTAVYLVHSPAQPVAFELKQMIFDALATTLEEEIVVQ